MIKKVTTSRAGTQEGTNVPAFLIRDSINFNNSGEVWINNPNGTLDGKYQVDDEITVEIGEILSGAEELDIIFKGLIADVDEDDRTRLVVAGFGRTLQRTQYKKTYHLIDAPKIIRDLLDPTGIDYETGTLPTDRRHTHICPNGSIWKELNRLNEAWNLQLVPYFNRRGVLILKTREEAAIDTDIEYNSGEFKNFQDHLLTLPLDQEIEAMMKIKILGQEYRVTEHQMRHDERRSTSTIVTAKI